MKTYMSSANTNSEAVLSQTAASECELDHSQKAEPPEASAIVNKDKDASVLLEADDFSIEAEDAELDALKKEINELLGDLKNEHGSELKWLSETHDSDDNGKYNLLCGTADCKVEVFFNIKSFTINSGKEPAEIRINLDTIIQLNSCNEGQEVYAIVCMTRGNLVAKIICTSEFYDMFYLIKNFNQKLAAMKKFMKLTSGQQKAIARQLDGKKHGVVGDNDITKIKDLDALRLKFDICREAYTQQQQREISSLFEQRFSGKDKNTRKLEYILNISSTAPDRKTPSRKDIIKALDTRLYKMDGVKMKIAESVVAGKYSNERGLRILLVGSPGTGKTTIAKAIAEAYGIPFEIINLNGVSSAIDLKGLDSSYDGSDAGKFVKTFFELGTSEAVIVLDEIGKMSKGGKDGDPADAMLDTLSDEHTCYDFFIEMAVDTSNTVYIATANTIQAIPEYLLNRFDVIHIDDYEDDDKVTIAKMYLIPQIIKTYSISAREVKFTDAALRCIVKNYCNDSGVRMLKENLRSIIRHIINRWDETGKRTKTVVDEAMAKNYLDTFVDENDPHLRFNRNKERFSAEVRAEIKQTFDTLRVTDLEPHKKETSTRKANYLTALIPAHGGFELFDMQAFFESVDSTHYGLSKVKDKIAKSFYTKALQKESFSSERILLVGGAGIGKSSICKSIANGLDIPYVKISLNGVSDTHTLKGFDPTYIGSDAGAIIKGLTRVGTTRALIQLDEIDKLGNYNGVNASTTLLDLLDNSSEFTDVFIGVPIDLSEVLFIATANGISQLEPWLLDRFSVIHLDGYTKTDKEQILTECLVPKLEKEYANAHISFSISNEAIRVLLADYCTSFGVRDLEKAVRQIATDILYKHGNTHTVSIEADDVIDCLGPKPIPRGNLLKENVPGFSKALAITGNNCGMSFSIETAVIHGDTSTCITGLPKESAIDSVKLAKTYIRLHYAANADEFGIHLHFGEGAVVKDGPSAGVAILISMLSAICNVPVVGDVAYTGEIDLFGNIFAIGGIMAKIQAAEQSGCSKVFIPKDNYEQLSAEDLIQFSVDVIPVQHVTEVIQAVLPQACSRNLAADI